jgi:beta-galactosidase
MSFLTHPDTPFPVGVEYFRAPVPEPSVWDADFARIRAAGLRVVRSFTFWNWMEPEPGVFQLDDFDRLFDLAEKHGLHVWLDIPLATHGACPEWLTREHPDVAVVDHHGQPVSPRASAAMPQGGMIHCYDHPLWREYGGRVLRRVVERYRERPNLLVWGLWDGVCPAHLSAGAAMGCYCASTLSRWQAWLQAQFSLDELNAYLHRRWPTWESVEAPRSDHMIVEMLLWRRFHRDNLVEHLDWMVAETRALDPHHEVRAHGASTPRPYDEACARSVDSWGMSMASNNLLTAGDRDFLADRAFIFDLSRSLGVSGRWWNEEIYSGMARGGVTWKKQSDPRELTMLLWMSLVHGAAGAMFWQYRPEYFSFESPGYNLVALDGEPTPRWEAVTTAVARIEGLRQHLPLACGQAEVGIVYHPESQELFGLNQETQRFDADLRGVYRSLWNQGIAADIVTPNQDWSGYRLLFLPNLALMTPELLTRVEATLADADGPRLVAEGSFGLYSPDGQSSYGPPEGLMERLGLRVADFSAVTPADIAAGRNVLHTAYGARSIHTPCGYAVLESRGDAQPCAHLDGATVGLTTDDGRFTWLGLTLSAGFGDTGDAPIVLGLARDAGVTSPVRLEGDPLVPIVRDSRAGGRLVFLLNPEPRAAHVRLQPPWPAAAVTDLLTGDSLDAADLRVCVDPWEVAVLHCRE